MKRPIGIAQEFAGEQHQVGFAGTDDFVRLFGFSDHSDCAGEDFGFALDAFRERDLVAGADLHFGIRNHGAGGTIDQIDFARFKLAGERDGIVKRPSAFFPIRCRDADEERKVLRPDGAHGLSQFENEANAILERSAVLISAMIGERREKFVREISVGAVKFEGFESGGEGAACGLGERFDDGVDSSEGERFGRPFLRAKWNVAGSNSLPSPGFQRYLSAIVLPWNVAACFSSGVRNLNAGNRAVLLNESRDALEHRDVFVFVDSMIAGANASACFYRSGFDDDKSSTTHGAAAEMDEVPIGRKSIVARVLAHRRNGDAVAIRDVADCERCEKMCAGQDLV